MTDPVRFSALKHIARSPMHYRHYVEHGRADKPWLRGGRGLHCVLFRQPFTVFDGASRNSKEWRKFCEDYPSTNEVMLPKELELYAAMAESILFELDRLDMTHLLAGDVERRIEWNWLGRDCAGTPDVQAYRGETLVTVDVKTTCNADPRRFHWDARKFAYAEQVTWYGHGREYADYASRNLSAFDDVEQEGFIVAVEKAAPHPVVVWRVTDRMREQAEKTLRLWMEQLLACEASNVWPGYAQCVQDLDVLDSEGGITLQIEGEEVEA